MTHSIPPGGPFVPKESEPPFKPETTWKSRQVTWDTKLAALDRDCDYIPILSCFTNAVDLIEKFYISAKGKGDSSLENGVYYSHLQRKSYFRCLMLVVLPFVSNLIFGIYDLTNKQQQNQLSQKNGQDDMSLKNASAERKEDKQQVMSAVMQKGMALKFAPDDLKKDRDIVLAAVRQNGLALQFASDDLKKDKDVGLAAVSQNGLVLEDLPENLQKDEDIVLAAVKQNPEAIRKAKVLNEAIIFHAYNLTKPLTLAIANINFAIKNNSSFSEQLVKMYGNSTVEITVDKAFLKNALWRDHKLIQYIPKDILYDYDFVRELLTPELIKDRQFIISLVKKEGLILELLPDYQNDKEVVLEALKVNKAAIEFVSDELKKDEDIQKAFSD